MRLSSTGYLTTLYRISDYMYASSQVYNVLHLQYCKISQKLVTPFLSLLIIATNSFVESSAQQCTQVALYTLMLSDRYSAHPTGGLLYYMKTGHMQGLPSLPHEIRGVCVL